MPRPPAGAVRYRAAEVYRGGLKMDDRSDHPGGPVAMPPPPKTGLSSSRPPVAPSGSHAAGLTEVRPQTPGGDEVASLDQRIGARAIDAACGLVLVLLLMVVQTALYAISGMERDAEGHDPINTGVNYLLVIAIVFYDAVTSRVCGGATPGKRITHCAVVNWGDGEPAGFPLLVGRNTLLFLEWIFLIPGILDLRSAAHRDDGRTWTDRVTGTAAVNRRAVPTLQTASSATPVWRPEPWGSLVQTAVEARARIVHTVKGVPEGPRRERLDEIVALIATCEVECTRVADRGIQLSQAANAIDITTLTSRLESIAGEPDKVSLAKAYEGELTSAQELLALVERTTQLLQELVAELNSAVNDGIRISLDPKDNMTFDEVLDQLHALQQSIAIIDGEFPPPGPM